MLCYIILCYSMYYSIVLYCNIWFGSAQTIIVFVYLYCTKSPGQNSKSIILICTHDIIYSSSSSKSYTCRIEIYDIIVIYTYIYIYIYVCIASTRTTKSPGSGDSRAPVCPRGKSIALYHNLLYRTSSHRARLCQRTPYLLCKVSVLLRGKSIALYHDLLYDAMI